MHTTALAHAHAAVERHRRERNAAALGLAAVAQQAVSGTDLFYVFSFEVCLPVFHTEVCEQLAQTT